MNRFYLVVLLVAVFAAGCSSSRKTAENEKPPYYLAAFEDFDPNEYPDVIPPIEAVSAEHEIPAKLEAKTNTGSAMVRGFRVQVFSSLDRSEANEAMQKAITWWEDRNDRRAARPPIYMEYEQPYYKVRAGNFRTRDAASKMAGQIARTFAGAFVVPSLVEAGR